MEITFISLPNWEWNVKRTGRTQRIICVGAVGCVVVLVVISSLCFSSGFHWRKTHKNKQTDSVLRMSRGLAERTKLFEIRARCGWPFLFPELSANKKKNNCTKYFMLMPHMLNQYLKASQENAKCKWREIGQTKRGIWSSEFAQQWNKTQLSTHKHENTKYEWVKLSKLCY